MSVKMIEKQSGSVLAEGDESSKGFVKYEGNLYFAPGSVKSEVLKLTERTYTCPFKGICHWVDYAGTDGKTVENVAWVYADPKPGHEVIKGHYGFHSGARGATRQE